MVVIKFMGGTFPLDKSSKAGPFTPHIIDLFGPISIGPRFEGCHWWRRGVTSYKKGKTGNDVIKTSHNKAKLSNQKVTKAILQRK